jgi:predicted nucleic acid-binding protein
MGKTDREDAVSDTSVLINFLAVGRIDLFVQHPKYRFVITDHVRREVTKHYPEEFERLETALRAGRLEQITVASEPELEIFGELIGSPKRLGTGESAAMAAAIHRNWAIAIDDYVAIKHLKAAYPQTMVATTQSLIVSLIKGGLLSIADADRMKGEWEAKYRFRLRIGSFRDVL